MTSPTLDVVRALTTPEEQQQFLVHLSPCFVSLAPRESVKALSRGLKPQGHCLVQPSQGALQARHFHAFSSEVSSLSEST